MKLIVFLLIFSFDAFCNEKNLVFIDNSVTNDTYIPSNKKRQIDIAFSLAEKELRRNYPRCDLKFIKMVARSGPLATINQATEIKSIYKKDSFVIGLIHSSEALLAAKAFKGSNIIGLSSGAATNMLANENSNFYSLANSVSRVSDHIVKFLRKEKIKKVLAIIPGNSSYSIELAKNLKTKALDTGEAVEIRHVDILKEGSLREALRDVHGFRLVYVPGFLQQTLPIFQGLAKIKYNGIIYGSANLARSTSDLKLFSDVLGLTNNRVLFPATWIKGETLSSQKIELTLKKDMNEEVMGTAIYTYDSAIVAGSYLCETQDISSVTFQKFIKMKIFSGDIRTARRYFSVEDGHFESHISTVKFDLIKNVISKEFEE